MFSCVAYHLLATWQLCTRTLLVAKEPAYSPWSIPNHIKAPLAAPSMVTSLQLAQLPPQQPIYTIQYQHAPAKHHRMLQCAGLKPRAVNNLIIGWHSGCQFSIPTTYSSAKMTWGVKGMWPNILIWSTWRSIHCIHSVYPTYWQPTSKVKQI